MEREKKSTRWVFLQNYRNDNESFLYLSYIYMADCIQHLWAQFSTNTYILSIFYLLLPSNPQKCLNGEINLRNIPKAGNTIIQMPLAEENYIK